MTPRFPGPVCSARDMVLGGSSALVSDEALLGLLVGDTVGAARLLSEHPPPDALWRVGADDIVRLRGVGPAGAARLLACLEMSRRAQAWASSSRPSISGPEDVVRMCGPQLRGRDREHFWALLLNTRNQLIRIEEVSIGSLNASIVHPRELFRLAVRVSAASVVVVHNHPSGDPTPSGADIQLTRRLVKAGDVLGIELLDHIVIGDGGEHASLRDLGVM